ncbi:hypothetical protein B7463_g2812, partial [Scytalidium lignicola]
MSSPAPSSGKKRKDATIPVKSKDASSTGIAAPPDPELDALVKANLQTTGKGAEWDYRIALAIITILAFATRFWGISHPNEVVFDEVHFGKFASYYLERTYFFDVHPPFGKLLFALMGWFVGYDGHFHFENIGDSYINNKVPYVAFRALPALLGALTVPVVFDIMWESGYTLPACVLSACLVLFDNAHIGQTRLILLDATLVFAMACSLLCYIKFYKLRHQPFGRKWWKWLILTGFALSCDISTKYVGLFAFITIGSAVAIDLWGLLDINRRQGALNLVDFGKHFAARALALIVFPFLFYLFWFQVHFAILSKSGPGDDFMSPEFQETLSDNAMSANAVTINFYDVVQIQHKETHAYLHSHPDKYPLRYDDGRVSSQGQQVTGYPYSDANNHWQILPLNDNREDGFPVKNNNLVRLRHLVTDSILLSHDVASPYYPTNQEFTTIPTAESTGDRFNDTLFEIRIENGKTNQELKSLSGQFKLIHNPSKVAMWTHTTPLPDWAYKQQEINGNKNLAQSSNICHPYASQPFVWPFLLRGVSFWTNNDTRQQIYFLGNPLGWWIASSLLAVFAGIIAADQLSLRRGVDALDQRARARLYNSTGFFFLAWATHYLPFYLMGRQLFLHHYLPAHLASCLVTGALLEFIFNVEPVVDDINFLGKNKKTGQPASKRHIPAREKLAGQNLLGSWAALGVILAIVLGGWYYFLPLTYGYPGLNVEQVLARKWLGYDLHFAK